MLYPQNLTIEGTDPRAEELRTLGLKNTDIKIIKCANVKQFSHLVALFAALIQRGFVEGRQLVLNIADLDDLCRAQANLSCFLGESILALWDFKAAFPSISREWIHFVFKKYGFPDWFLSFLEALLFHNFVFFIREGTRPFFTLSFRALCRDAHQQACSSLALRTPSL